MWAYDWVIVPCGDLRVEKSFGYYSVGLDNKICIEVH